MTAYPFPYLTGTPWPVTVFTVMFSLLVTAMIMWIDVRILTELVRMFKLRGGDDKK